VGEAANLPLLITEKEKEEMEKKRGRKKFNSFHMQTFKSWMKT
jgi:hypothetical protein